MGVMFLTSDVDVALLHQCYEMGEYDYLLKPKSENYTRNEWRRWKSTLQTNGEDVKLHSKPVERM